MTVNSTTNRSSHVGNGVTTAFATGFPFLLAADLVVLERNDTTGVQIVKTITTHYTVSGGSGSTGTVTMLTAPATGVSLVIYRDPALTQLVDLVNNDPLPVETAVEQPLDRLTMMEQRTRELVERSIRLPEGDTGFVAADMVLPAEVDRANKFVAFDADGKLVASSGVGTDSALRTDLADTANAVLGDALIGVKRTSTGAVATTQHALNNARSIDAKLDFGAVGNDTADDIAALAAAYAAAKALKCSLYLGANVTYKITSQLVWDGSVDVYGGGEYCIIKPYGNFDALKITGAAQESTFSSFSVNRGSGTGNGIWVNNAAHAVFNSVKSRGHSGHAWYLYNATTPTGFFTIYNNCSGALCGGDAWYVYNHYRSIWISSEGDISTGWGFNFVLGDYHTGVNTQSQGNTAGGYQFATAQNNFDVYGEDNTGPDLYLTATSQHNLNNVINITTYPDDLVDLGTDNTQISASGLLGVLTRRISRPKRTTNVVGLPVSFQGGAAGAGATGRAGGDANHIGGDAAGNTLSKGGRALSRGGSGTSGGADGDFIVQAGGGQTVIGADQSPTNAFTDFEWTSTTKVNLPHRLTTTQEDALTTTAGMGPWYNTTLGKFRARVGGTPKQSFLTYLEGSKTYDPPSLGAGVSTSTTVTVSDASLGDFAIASFSLDLQGIMVTAYSQGGDTVTVVFFNRTAGTIDLASGTLTVRLMRA